MKKFPLVTRRRLKAAIAQKDAAIAERNAAVAHKDTAINERNAAIAERDAATAKLHRGFAKDIDGVRTELQEALGAFSRVVNSNGLSRLNPVAVCRNVAEWNRFIASDEYKNMRVADAAIISAHQHEAEWGLTGYSLPASQAVNFKVDMLGSGRRSGDLYIPNIRERLECPITKLNNRQRLVAGLLASELSKQSAKFDIYFMEQVTSIFAWAKTTFQDQNIVGSEFLGASVEPGALLDGVRHENLLNLSFDNASLDLIISNDVMEHVPSPEAAFKELARVMRSNAQALMTFPFLTELEHSVTRAKLVDGGIEHLREPVYHGNPVSQDGSLVFTDFGWDIFDIVKNCGFSDLALEIYHSTALGHLGSLMIFRLRR